ncbi:D-alanyl-D-alanine carboxypeptidase family protein [Actinomycetota bacterium Odt1-20B]
MNVVDRIRTAAVGRPPQGHRARGRWARGRVVCGAAAVLAVVGVGGWAGLTGQGPDRAAVVSGQSAVAKRLDLSWPREGEASIALDGVGTLGSSGGQKPVPIASVAKVMTAYVILKEHPLKGGEQGPRIEVDAAAEQEAYSPDESSAPVRAGLRLTERRLLELLLLPSGNNIARLLARWDAGSQQAFTAKMNDAARGLGMDRTTYTGASGFETTTRSTADDQLKLAREAMKEPVLRAVVAQRSTTVPGIPGPIANTNTLLDRPGVIGLKTGSSTPAGGNLMWAVEVKSGGKRHLVLGVVLGQRAGTSPTEGLQAALDTSGALIDAVEKQLPDALAAAETGAGA